MWWHEGLGDAHAALALCELRSPDLGHGGHHVSGHAHPPADVVPRDVVRDECQDRDQDRLTGPVEVDETLVGGFGGARGRSTATKALVVVAAEEVGRGIGRIRMAHIPDGSAETLEAFVAEAIEPGSGVHTDGWHGYTHLGANGYHHRVTPLRGDHALASELLPRVHRVVSLLKRWLLGTHHGGVSRAHLDAYLDEFTFRFNRRRSRHRGKLFFRLVQQAVTLEPVPYEQLIQRGRRR